jgi:N-acetylglutamate synthase-like GNAT family acetyltransferase
LVGFASLADTGNGAHEMNDVSILPEYRHFGYGKELLDYCAGHCWWMNRWEE